MEAKVQSPIVSDPVGVEVSPDFAVKMDTFEKVSDTDIRETSIEILEENEVLLTCRSFGRYHPRPRCNRRRTVVDPMHAFPLRQAVTRTRSYLPKTKEEKQ